MGRLGSASWCSSSRQLKLLLGAVAVILLSSSLVYGSCIPAIYNFGDSTSDTGNLAATFPGFTQGEHSPYGETYFGKPVGRYSDGRLLIDFIANGLGLPFLDPYQQTVNSNYTQGADFACAGSTVLPVTYLSPFYLDIQLRQFGAFKWNVQNVFYPQNGTVDVALASRLPNPDTISKALYTIALGGNDFTYGYTRGQSIDQVKLYLPQVIGNLTAAVQRLYNYGARNFIVWDIEPNGCLPYTLTLITHNASDVDARGCLIAYNDVAVWFNIQFKASLDALRANLTDANIIFFSTYDLKMDIIANASQLGFNYTTIACCGVPSTYHYSLSVNCGQSNVINGVNYTSTTCDNPGEYLVWDGVHNTDRANRYIAQQFFSGAYFDPPFPLLTQNCSLTPI
ncbi:unnamed protein product [Calypogeia fissa]